MTSPPAPDLFTHVHKGLRHGLFGAVELLGRTDWSDPTSIGEATARWTELDAQLTAHAHHEDDFIFPMLEVHRPGATAALHADHETIDEMQRVATEAVAHAAASASGTDGLHAYRLASGLAGAYLSHLLDEERTVMPAILECCSREEIEACRRAFLATVPPDHAAVNSDGSCCRSTTPPGWAWSPAHAARCHPKPSPRCSRLHATSCPFTTSRDSTPPSPRQHEKERPRCPLFRRFVRFASDGPEPSISIG